MTTPARLVPHMDYRDPKPDEYMVSAENHGADKPWDLWLVDDEGGLIVKFASVSDRGMERHKLGSRFAPPFPLDAQGRIALAGEYQPAGEWRRGWIGKDIGLYGYEPHIGATPIEYRVVSEGEVKPQVVKYGIEHDDGSMSLSSSEQRMRGLELGEGDKRVRVTMTVEPAGEVG